MRKVIFMELWVIVMKLSLLGEIEVNYVSHQLIHHWS